MPKNNHDKKMLLRYHRSLVRAIVSLCIWAVALSASFFVRWSPQTSDGIDTASTFRSSHEADRASRIGSDPSESGIGEEIKPLPTQQSPDGGAFVHIGKTGGSTISVVLRNGCHSYRPHPCRNITKETIASKLIQSYYHVPDFGLLPQSKHDFYLVSTRDPVDRVVSSFVYEHYANRRARQEPMDPTKVQKMQDAYSCFPSLESFVGYFDADDPRKYDYPYTKSEVNNSKCQDLARAALYGKVRVYGHLFFGYERIRSLILATIHEEQHRLVLYATRQEHLQRDWQAVNRHLGQVEAVGLLPHQRTQHSSVQTMPVPKTLSRRGRRLLCNALTGEYEAYVWFLQHANNLSREDVVESMQYSISQCPQLTRMLLEAQQYQQV
jgi:Sulfotransferase family